MFKKVLPLLKISIVSMTTISKSFVISDSNNVDAPSAKFFVDIILKEFLTSLLTDIDTVFDIVQSVSVSVQSRVSTF